MLRVDDLTVSYAGVTAIRGVSLGVAEHEIVALLGANGAGKSTLLRATSGLLRAESGEIAFGGVPIHGLPPVCSPSSRAWPSGGSRSRARCREASSRCSRSAAR